jgi:hypothetical protein
MSQRKERYFVLGREFRIPVSIVVVVSFVEFATKSHQSWCCCQGLKLRKSHVFESSIKSEQLRIDLYQEINETKKKKKDTKPPQLVGSVHIQLSTIENNQCIEKWYRVENADSMMATMVVLATLPMTTAPPTGSLTSESHTTTHALNNTKDSISLRIKAKYQCVDILPLNYYDRLVKVTMKCCAELCCVNEFTSHHSSMRSA